MVRANGGRVKFRAALNRVTADKPESGHRQLARTGHQDALDKFDKLAGAISGKMVDLTKHVGQLDKFIVATSVAIKKQNDELSKISDQIVKTNDPKAKKAADELLYNLMKGIGTLRAIDDVRTAAAEVKKVWDREQVLNPSALDPALKKLGDAAPFLMQIKDGAVALSDPIKKFAAALK